MTAEEGLDAAAQPLKVDPETLALRGRPRAIARFRRGVVMGGVAAVSLGLIGLTWLALEPITIRKVAEGEGGRPFEQTRPDALAGAPRDYRDVPKLGPPLPGDLGRPILEQQREVQQANVRAVPPAAHNSSQPDEREQQRLAGEQGARASSVLINLAASRPASPPSDTLQTPPVGGQSSAPPTNSKGQLGDWQSNDINVHALAPAPSPLEITAGTIIPAALLTGLNSDLPGMVVAQISENVRDSATGKIVLIPQGARLIGRYDSAVAYGQKRAFVIWQRIMFPNGSSLRLDNMPATDAAGYAGLSDKADGHSWQVIRGVVLSSLLAVGTQLSFGSDAGLVRALRESAQQSGSQAGGQIVSKGLSVQPTIKVRPGWPVRLLVSEDMVLEPWKG